ncbi:hypothetical protein HMPREF9080_01190 [Cardiobacterium valvarum F0432]|uniref:Uncharacterized protein n=1 Tax=Cardiobacterium valvarum F0432 TaxID=797473 RepID=G9ZEL0_9GAMM|nr:hypothetical protein HMPREF9080_01190 [Cardiobacterium valvarum F0432]
MAASRRQYKRVRRGSPTPQEGAKVSARKGGHQPAFMPYNIT